MVLRANTMYIVVLMLISCFVMSPCNGNESIATQTVRDKRYDGLMRELVDLLSEQKSERNMLLKKCAYVENMIKKLTTGLRTTKRSVKHLEKTTTKQHSKTLKRCEDIEGEVKKLNSALGTTKQSLKRLGETTTRQHSTTQQQVNGIVGTVKDLNTRTKQHSSQLNKIESDIKAINNTRGIRNGIGFSVKFKFGGGVSYSNDAIVKFNNVISNYGNGFNVASGKFTCKVPGMYFFTVTVISETNHGATWIMTSIKNRTKIIESLTTYELPKTKSEKRYESGTASTVLRLGVGDEVFVKPVSLSGKVSFEWNSSFSGMLISE